MIETTHNGHVIRYSENADEWVCSDLDVRGKTLSAIKTTINKVDADARRVANVPVIIVTQYSAHEFGKVTLIENGSAWVSIFLRKGNGGKPDLTSRRKINLKNMVLDTPENRRLLAAAIELSKNVEDARVKAAEARENIPRITVADLKGTPDTKESAA
jgi:hypothetical protein